MHSCSYKQRQHPIRSAPTIELESTSANPSGNDFFHKFCIPLTNNTNQAVSRKTRHKSSKEKHKGNMITRYYPVQI
ncbi:hypothetical protein EYC84_009737 [Monilinia fructicola]|uniref:Uncharacterized protein n=1 Tax=Monilinia fructicola TaxID=38448 RepID=A0A5M9J8I7_MONFR|nr:hypothetical protein EYC84_009737 [Monilinia fructicola]